MYNVSVIVFKRKNKPTDKKKKHRKQCIWGRTTYSTEQCFQLLAPKWSSLLAAWKGWRSVIVHYFCFTIKKSVFFLELGLNSWRQLKHTRKVSSYIHNWVSLYRDPHSVLTSFPSSSLPPPSAAPSSFQQPGDLSSSKLNQIFCRSCFTAAISLVPNKPAFRSLFNLP